MCKGARGRQESPCGTHPPKPDNKSSPLLAPNEGKGQGERGDCTNVEGEVCRMDDCADKRDLVERSPPGRAATTNDQAARLKNFRA